MPRTQPAAKKKKPAKPPPKALGNPKALGKPKKPPQKKPEPKPKPKSVPKSQSKKSLRAVPVAVKNGSTPIAPARLEWEALRALPPAGIALLNQLAQLRLHPQADAFPDVWRLAAHAAWRAAVWFEVTAENAEGALRLVLDAALLNALLHRQLAPWRGEEVGEEILELALQLAVPEAWQLQNVRLRRHKASPAPPQSLVFRALRHSAPQGSLMIDAPNAARLARLLASLMARQPEHYARALRVRVPIFCGRAHLRDHEIQALGKGDIIFLETL